MCIRDSSWTLVDKRLKIGPEFLPTLCKFCIPFHSQALQMQIRKRSSNFAKRRMANRANNLRWKSWSHLSLKIGSKNFDTCSAFRRLRALMANIYWTKCDINNRRWKVQVVSYIVWKFRELCYTNGWKILSSASLPAVVHGKRNPTKLCQMRGGRWRWYEPNKVASCSECKWDHRNQVAGVPWPQKPF